MRIPFFLPVAGILLWVACQNENAGEGVQEIRGDGPNANIIRNPISSDQPLDTNQLARIVFTEAVYDFGAVDEGEVVEHDFAFKNTGNVPLTIRDARSSCGCTVPEWPEAPIPPGGTGVIKARFNTKDKPEQQKKMITVTANTYPNETKVILKGYVNPK